MRIELVLVIIIINKCIYIFNKGSDEGNTIFRNSGVLTIFILYGIFYVTGFAVLYWFGFFEE
jgi:hypothetical protein